MSNLLSQASLVMIPSGYKEDVVYSQIPTSGAGDLSFTRASNGTRINSAGLVEVCPWNFNTNSDNFTNSWGTDGTSTATNNFATAPNGTMTAAKVVANSNNGYAYKFVAVPVGVYTLSFYVKGSVSGTFAILINDINGSGTNQSSNFTVTTEWQRYEYSANVTDGTNLYINYVNLQTSRDYFIWGAQLNIGSTAKPYFPTTDRLNVPRLTYQNGGGGCPSLLLEKQSTNLVSWSDDFSNSDWGKYQCSISTNQTTSPDGTQNADKLTLSGNSGTYTGLVYRTTTPAANSIYMKNDSIGSGKFYIQVDGVGNAKWNSDGTLNSVSGGTATNGENMGNGWFRFAYVVTSGAYINCGIVDGTTGDSIFIWGAQVEAGSYPTSLINTTSSSATRVADACFKTGISSLIGQSEGTLFFDGYCNNDAEIISINRSTINSVFLYSASGNVRGYVYSDSTGFNLLSSISCFTRFKAAVAYKSNSIAFYVNGTLITQDTSTTFTPNVTMENFYIAQGGYVSGKEQVNCNQAIIFPTRLTNAELASLTTI